MSTGVADGGLTGRLAILHPAGRMSLAHNPFGKDVANLQLWRALARHGGFERIDVLSQQAAAPADVAHDIYDGAPGATAIGAELLIQSEAPAAAGTLLRGQPDLADLAWMRRRRASDRAWSLVGLIHTIAPPTMRRIIAEAQVAPLHPWDALICTSPAVRDNLQAMFDGWGAHLAERTGGRAPPLPALPVIPLGVDAPAMAATADRPDARARARAALGLADDDVLVLWVGRLSYYEKAFPQAMFRALQKAKTATGARIGFAMAGWFPGDADQGYYEQAAVQLAPGVDVHFVDGNDRGRLDDLWAGADVFLSLVDNIQETFGITPLEAMAAGLPVVASDWDGYRFTVRHGAEGFLVPTLGGPAGGGYGAAMVERHATEGAAYQVYVGQVAQHTAVHVDRAADALAELIRSPELRRRMGAAGRARVAAMFDWPVVARQIHALADDLAQARARAADPPARMRADPVKGDPFRDFAGFASAALTLETRVRAVAGVTGDQIAAAADLVALDGAFPSFRAPPNLCVQVFALISERGGAAARDILMAFPPPQRRAIELGLAWMAKCGFLDWLD